MGIGGLRASWLATVPGGSWNQLEDQGRRGLPKGWAMEMMENRLLGRLAALRIRGDGTGRVGGCADMSPVLGLKVVGLGKKNWDGAAAMGRLRIRGLQSLRLGFLVRAPVQQPWRFGQLQSCTGSQVTPTLFSNHGVSGGSKTLSGARNTQPVFSNLAF